MEARIAKAGKTLTAHHYRVAAVRVSPLHLTIPPPLIISTKESPPLELKRVNSHLSFVRKFELCCILIGRKFAAINLFNDLLPFLERGLLSRFRNSAL